MISSMPLRALHREAASEGSIIFKSWRDAARITPD